MTPHELREDPAAQVVLALLVLAGVLAWLAPSLAGVVGALSGASYRPSASAGAATTTLPASAHALGIHAAAESPGSIRNPGRVLLSAEGAPPGRTVLLAWNGTGTLLVLP